MLGSATRNLAAAGRTPIVNAASMMMTFSAAERNVLLGSAKRSARVLLFAPDLRQSISTGGAAALLDELAAPCKTNRKQKAPGVAHTVNASSLPIALPRWLRGASAPCKWFQTKIIFAIHAHHCLASPEFFQTVGRRLSWQLDSRWLWPL